ncbi:MAG: hypothetical protein KDJ29_13450 [Hyphomicrobiales bacterium]|nr:hypothetical protein [Hyphomicrobiales bacterium]
MNWNGTRMFGRFLRDRDGAVAIMFALCFIAIIGIVGLALDYSRAATERENLQSATDAAVQAAAVTPGTAAEREKVFNNMLDAHLAGSGTLHAIRAAVSIDPSTNKVTATVRAKIKTSIMAAVGFNTMDIAVDSEMLGGKVDVEFALALDVSGSMRARMPSGETRLKSMQDAVNTMIDTVKANISGTSTAKYSIVPFTMNVNIGTNNASYVEGTTHPLFNGTQWAGCVTERAPPHHISNAYNGSASSPLGKWQAYINPPEPDTNSVCAVPSNGTNSGYRTVAPYSTSSYVSQTQGPNFNCVRHPIMTLTSDGDATKAKVNQLTSESNLGTIVAPGVSWGLRLLTPNAPFPGARPFSSGVRKVLVVLTDGEQTTEWGSSSCNKATNTTTEFKYDPDQFKLGGAALSTTGPRDYFSAYGYIYDSDPFGNNYTDYSQVDPSLDKLSIAACSEAKKQPGLEIYAIAVSASAGPGTRAYNVMSACASSSRHLFYASDTAALKQAFEDIAKRSTKLRRTQ